MKVRVKFSKSGVMKFIGHLDIMRFFQKAIRRAGMDSAYSGGFSPRQIMSFAAPLGVGILSCGEYMDIELNSSESSKDMLNKLNEQMVPGIEVFSIKELDKDSKNSMSIVAAADYEITLPKEIESIVDFKKIFEFYEQEQIIICKKTKKSCQEADIKPFIYHLDIKENSVLMTLATGSVSNLKPGLVMEAFAEYLGIQIPEFSLQVKRLELYADTGKEGERNLVSLESFGKDIL